MSSSSSSSSTVSSGITTFGAVGSAIAVQISWAFNHSIGWALWHGLLGWVYVIYRWWIQSYQ